MQTSCPPPFAHIVCIVCGRQVLLLCSPDVCSPLLAFWTLSPPLPSISLELFGCPHKSYCLSLLHKVPACFPFWLICWSSIPALEPQGSLSVGVWCSYSPWGVLPIAPLLLKLLLLDPTKQSLVMVPRAWTSNEPLQILQCFCSWPPWSGSHHKIKTQESHPKTQKLGFTSPRVNKHLNLYYDTISIPHQKDDCTNRLPQQDSMGEQCKAFFWPHLCHQ